MGMDNETVESVERQCRVLRRRLIADVIFCTLSVFGLVGVVVGLVAVIING